MVHAGSKIKLLRESKGWSREQLGEKVNKSVETIAKIEQGKHKLTLDEAELFGELFDVDPALFFSRSNGIVFKNISNSPAVGIGNTVSMDTNIIESFVKTIDKFTDYLQSRSEV